MNHSIPFDFRLDKAAATFLKYMNKSNAVDPLMSNEMHKKVNAILNAERENL